LQRRVAKKEVSVETLGSAAVEESQPALLRSPERFINRELS